MAKAHEQRKAAVLDDRPAPQPEHPPEEIGVPPRRSTARALLKHAGTWVGDDADRCLREVYAARGETTF